jgi:hypothetical protein
MAKDAAAAKGNLSNFGVQPAVVEVFEILHRIGRNGSARDDVRKA